jgi:hypothetical protein
MKAIQKVCFCFGFIILLADNAQAGRWLTRDPIEFMERDPKPTISAPPLTLFLNQQVNLYRFVDNNPLNEVDVLGLYPWQTQWWADLSVNGNWAERTTADIFGPLSAMIPDAGGISGGGTAGSGIVGSVGAANMSFLANDPCQGHNATFTTVGVGVGSTQAGVNAGFALGWANFESPTASSFTGDFTEGNITIGPYSVTLWGGGGWAGITVGPASGAPAVSGAVQNVNYQFAH